MTGHHDRDERDPIEFPLCQECGFRIIDEQPLLGRYGYVHAKCLEAS